MWTNPFYGYQYLENGRIFGMVCNYDNYAITGIFSWNTYKWSFEKSFYKSEYGIDYLNEAKKFVEKNINNLA
jgi:hypothetical protein